GISLGLRPEFTFLRLLRGGHLAYFHARWLSRQTPCRLRRGPPLARIPRRSGLYALGAPHDGDRPDFGWLGHGRRRRSDSFRAVRRAGVPPRRGGHRRHLGLRRHWPAR